MKKNVLKLLSFLSTSIIFLTIALSDHSEAQLSIPSNQLASEEGIFIFVQTIVENLDGQLVTYLTSDKFTDIEYDILEALLENEESEDDPIIVIDDQKYQVIQRLIKINYDKDDVIASTIMAYTPNDAPKTVARFAHDGYPLLEGETVISVWTFIRPID